MKLQVNLEVKDSEVRLHATVCWREEGMMTYVASSPSSLTPPRANQGLEFEISYLSFEST